MSTEMAELDNDITVPRSDLEAALDEMVDSGKPDKQYVEVGDVALYRADGHSAHVHEVADNGGLTINRATISVGELRDATRVPFDEFVEAEFATGHFSSIEVLDNQAYFAEGDLDVATDQSRPTVGRSVVNALDESDDVKMGAISHGDGVDGDPVGDERDEPLVRINLEDTRDE